MGFFREFKKAFKEGLAMGPREMFKKSVNELKEARAEGGIIVKKK